MFKLPVFGSRGKVDSNVQSHARGHVGARPPQPFSENTLHKTARIKDATVVEGVCPYCAVGCGLHIYTKGGKIVDIEGNPRSPINQGTLCPKGANTFQLVNNLHRVTNVMYRAPYSTAWELKSLDWAMEQIAQRVYDAREKDFERMTPDGALTLNHVKSFGTLGGATLDNEENYLIKKLLSFGLGVVSIENQARI